VNNISPHPRWTKRQDVKVQHPFLPSKVASDQYVLEQGVGMLAKPGTQQAATPLPEGTPNLRGSFMIYVYPDIEFAWRRIKEDVYWESGVWDKEKTEIWPLLK